MGWDGSLNGLTVRAPNGAKNLIARAEMEQRADGVDASALVFFLGCANSLAVYGKAS